MIEVHKFGGTILGDPKKIAKVLEIITKNQDKQLFIVLSASFGITDKLFDLLQTTLETINVDTFVEELRIHYIHLLGSFVEGIEENKQIFDPLFRRFSALLNGAIFAGKIPTTLKNQLIIYGEKLSVVLIKIILHSKGISATTLEPKEFILTNNVLNDAIIDLDSSTKYLQKLVKQTKHKTFLIPGYYGFTANHDVSLLGRSGSDYTATAIAYMMKANQVVIWKDVSGLMTSDPNIVQKAKPISELSYDQAIELSAFGAKVLQSKSAGPCLLLNIPILAKDINSPSTFTTIKQHNPDQDEIKSITFVEEICLLQFRSKTRNINQSLNMIKDTLLEIIEKSLIQIVSPTLATFIIKGCLLENEISQLLLDAELLDDIDFEIRKNQSLVAVIGSDIENNSELFLKLERIYKELNLNPIEIMTYLSPISYSIVVKTKMCVELVNKLHDELIFNLSTVR